MYGEFSVKHPDDFADFHVRVASPSGLRKWLKPQVNFFLDETASFNPLPREQAYPMLEWGINWCIAAHSHQYLIFHAAVIEKHGSAVIMPAPPGSGKSTLCAGLVSRGWRLLSDELALFDMKSGTIQPLSRPINLKNESIDVIKRFQPDAVMTAPVADTVKGTVALLRPPAESVRRISESATPAWIILPRYKRGAAANLTLQSKARTCQTLVEQSFNYDIHGRAGFAAITSLVDACYCYELVYSDLEEANHMFTGLPDLPNITRLAA